MSKHVQMELGATGGGGDKKKGGWSVKQTESLVKLFADLIEQSYDCKAKDRNYYFWMVLARRMQEFFTTDSSAPSFKMAATVQDHVQGGAYYRVEPFEHALEAAINAWKQSGHKSAPSPGDFLEVECRLACSFSAVVDIVSQKQKVRPWDIKLWVYSDENKPTESTVTKRARAEDVLFWARFFGDFQTKVPVEKLATALWLHIKMVEHQEVNVTRQIFTKLVKSTIGVSEGELVSIEAPSEKSPHTFSRFIKKYGPTLDKVFGHMCGATRVTGELCSWLDYDIDAEKATAILEAEEEDEENGKNFIIRLARDKESFVIHYWMTQNDDEADEQTTKQQVSKLSLDEEGYFAPSKKPTKYPTLREVLLRHVCKEYDYENEATLLDAEKMEWAGAYRVRRTASHAVSKGRSSTVTSGANSGIESLANEDAAELLKNLWEFLRFEEDMFGRVIREFSDTLVDQEKDRDTFEQLCGFLDQDMNGELDSNETLIGIYMVLEPVLEGLDLTKVGGLDAQQQLLELLPDQFVDGLDLAAFRSLFALTLAKLYFLALRDAAKNQKAWGDAEKANFIAGVKQSIAQRHGEMLKQGGARLDDEEDLGIKANCSSLFSFLWLWLAFPMSMSISIVYPRNAKVVPGCCKRFLISLGRFLLTTVMSIVIAFFYYSPVVSVSLYHRNWRKVGENITAGGDGLSACEAWAPAVLSLILVVVMAVGGAVHRKREQRLAERRWLNSELIIRGSTKSRVSPKMLTRVGGDGPSTNGSNPDKFDAVNCVFVDKSHLTVGMESRSYAQFGKMVQSYYEGSEGFFRACIALLFGLGCALIPGIYRTNHRPRSFFFAGTHPFEILVAMIYLVTTTIGSTAMLIFIQGSALHYNSIRVSLSNAIALTDPRKATALGFSHYFPMQQPENIEYWILVRDAVKRQVDPSMDTIVACALLLDVAMLVILVVRIIVIGKEPGASYIDLTNLICIYVLAVVTGYLLQFIAAVVVLNGKVRQETMLCLEQVKLKLALEINKVEKLSSREVVTTRKDARAIHPLVKSGDTASDDTLRDLHACNLIVESALSSMQNLDRPITVIGITIDTAFVVKLVSLIGAGIGPVLISVLKTNSSSSSGNSPTHAPTM